MKRPGLSPCLLSATLFLVLGLPEAAAAKKPKASGTTPPAAATGETATVGGADDIKRFDRDGDGLLDDAERAAAKAQLMKEPAAPAAAATGGKKNRGTAGEAMRERVVAQFDANKDGKLDDTERAAARKAFGDKSGKVRDELLLRFDENGNGRIDPDERAAAAAAVKKRRSGNAVAAQPAPATDADVEGTLRAAIAADATRLQRFDTDHDGKLSDPEWSAARKAIARLLDAP